MNQYDIEMEKAVRIYKRNEFLIADLEARKISSWNIIGKYTRAYRLREAKLLRQDVLEFMQHLIEHNPKLETS